MGNLTKEEIHEMERMLHFESVLIKKYASLSNTCTDPQIRAKFEQISARHQDHLNRLLNYLE